MRAGPSRARVALLGLVLAGAAVGPLAGPARADDALEQRLQQLETLLRQQGAELARLRAEAASRGEATSPPAPAPAAVAPAPVAVSPWTAPSPATGLSAPPPADPRAVVAAAAPGSGVRASNLDGDLPGGVRWGGYGTVEWIAPSDANSHFDLHRLVLTLDAPITRCLDFQGEIEFEHGGIGGPLDGEVIVEQAAFTFRLTDWLHLKAGALLVPFGRTNLYHDDPIHDFTLRPWTGRFLVPTGWGVPGVGAEGAVALGCHTLTYDVALNNGVKDAFSPSSGIRTARQDWEADNNENKQVFGRVAMAWRVPGFARLETGVSGTFGTYDDAGENDLTGFGLDLMARAGPFEVTGEVLRYDLERDAADPAGAIRGLSGLWVQAAYHFFPSFLCGCRGCLVEDTSHFTLAVRYMTTDLDDAVEGAAFRDDLKSWGVALNYRLTERTVIRVDHTWFDPVNGDGTRELTVSLSTYF